MKEQIEKKWDSILNLLESQYDVSRIIIDTWIKSLNIYEVKDNVPLVYTVNIIYIIYIIYIAKGGCSSWRQKH